jgi:transcriptional regulator with XRE-family HTH domain
MLDPDELGHSKDDLAKALRELRGACGMSGAGAAKRAFMSQPKISRIENGRHIPDAGEVARLCETYDADERTTARLLALARLSRTDYRSDRASARKGFQHKQAELSGFEAKAEVMRHFLPAAPTGLIQTRAYAEAAVSLHRPLTPEVKARVLNAKMQRQDVLHDLDRHFVFLLTEAAIRARIVPRVVMAEQCDHMATVAELPNVELAVIPFGVQFPAMPLNTFVVYDERFVTVELFSGEVLLHDPYDVAEHLALFALLHKAAITGAACQAFLRGLAAQYAAEAETG